ncbi:MAG: hypothetical protein K1W36_08970 [Lachnospiraceae bacterium]|nr:hypothetical protein [Lachnospiraceae bacterium]
MEIKDYVELSRIQDLLDSFSGVTDFEVMVVGKDGKFLVGKNEFRVGENDSSCDIVIDKDKLGAVVVREHPEKSAAQAAELLGMMMNQFMNLEYFNSINSGRFDTIKNDIKKSGQLVQTINEKTGHLKGIAKKQTILSLNATIEAARSGEAGVGFAVVAKSMQDLSNQSAGIYNDIETSVGEITSLINTIIVAFE